MTGPSGDGALTAPAVARNREPILAVLRRVLPVRGTVLEIASGSGEHAVPAFLLCSGPDETPAFVALTRKRSDMHRPDVIQNALRDADKRTVAHVALP